MPEAIAVLREMPWGDDYAVGPRYRPRQLRERLCEVPYGPGVLRGADHPAARATDVPGQHASATLQLVTDRRRRARGLISEVIKARATRMLSRRLPSRSSCAQPPSSVDWYRVALSRPALEPIS